MKGRRRNPLNYLVWTNLSVPGIKLLTKVAKFFNFQPLWFYSPTNTISPVSIALLPDNYPSTPNSPLDDIFRCYLFLQHKKVISESEDGQGHLSFQNIEQLFSMDNGRTTKCTQFFLLKPKKSHKVKFTRDVFYCSFCYCHVKDLLKLLYSSFFITKSVEYLFISQWVNSFKLFKKTLMSCLTWNKRK